MLDGLAPFLVSFQHRDKFFLGALVVLKGAGSFAAHRFNDVGVLVLTGELVKAVFIGKSLNCDCEHFVASFFCTYTFKCRKRIFTRPRGSYYLYKMTHGGR